MNDVDDRLLKRFTAIKNIEYYIEESVYYRTHFSDLLGLEKKTLWSSENNISKVRVYED